MDQGVLEELIAKELPTLSTRLKDMGTAQMITLSWFLTVFLNVLPYQTAVYVMDGFFCEGARVIFQLTLTILSKNEDFIMNSHDDGEAMMKLGNFFKHDVSNNEEDENSISKLLCQAMENFSHISRFDIEKIRFKHRLQVVQNLEDAMMKNVVRSVQNEAENLSEEELKCLFAIVKNEQFQRQQRLETSAGIQHIFNSNLPFYQLYQTDFDTFNAIHSHLSLWGSENDETTSVILADRIFRLMDSDRDGLLNFAELAQIFNALCKGDHVMKLRLFYCLHLPGVVLPGELSELNKPHLETDQVDAAEEACDAQQFFNVASQEFEEVTQQLKDTDLLEDKQSKFMWHCKLC